eukprot:TRINITY_DN8269_c0_g4_i1.p3 TRINITY_DN8269_c0_g4~~TRINITY_DN8269_c0_g4_i1.p3  ORF type:complete len:126 (+),score=8.92 TRINITY_DN8269_c0_g4_i1:878-1255(+)
MFRDAERAAGSGVKACGSSKKLSQKELAELYKRAQPSQHTEVKIDDIAAPSGGGGGGVPRHRQSQQGAGADRTCCEGVARAVGGPPCQGGADADAGARVLYCGRPLALALESSFLAFSFKDYIPP